MEPTMIYSRRIDPRGVVALLRSLDPAVEVGGTDDDWTSATLSLSQPGSTVPLILSFLPTLYAAWKAAGTVPVQGLRYE